MVEGHHRARSQGARHQRDDHVAQQPDAAPGGWGGIGGNGEVEP